MAETLTSGPVTAGPSTTTFERVTGLHVLVADSDAASRAMREQQLLAAGHRVSVARTSFETIVKASCHLPDCILLDSALGDMGPADTRAMLSTCPVTAHIPVLALTRGRRVPQRILTELRRQTR